MTNYPKKLQETLEDFSFITNRIERQDYLIQLADQFSDVRVPERIATKPYDESHRVPDCESDAFVWWEENENGTLHYYFDVLNPQGLSAMAMAVIMGHACNGASLEEVASIKTEIVLDFFGQNISMGKGQGLMGIVKMVTTAARQHLG